MPTPDLLQHRLAEPIRPLAERVDAWTSELLETYLQQFPQNPFKTGKTFQDIVWGAIELRAAELYLLDSPLLQRLRYVSQLGVAHYLFPTIGYSRFEHSIGALHQISRMIGALQATRTPPEELRKASYEQCLRFAALLHDVGHCAFSHVSEKFYQFHEDMVAARGALGKLYAKQPSASEVLSILIVSSPTVRQLIKVPTDQAGEQALGHDEGVELVAACIAGTNVEPWQPYLSQLVNGTIDCDKLDYLARDGALAGTPVMMDVARLLSKLRVVGVPDRGNLKLLGLDITGTRALEELLATRVFLYDKIYFHHKILAAEELLRHGFAQLERVVPQIRDPAVMLRMFDEDFLRYRFDSQTRGEADSDVRQAAALFARVANRNLPRRQCAIAHRFWLRPPALIAEISSVVSVGDPRYTKKVARDVLDSLGKDNNRRTLADEIRSYASTLGVDQEVYVAWPDAQRVAFPTGDLKAVDADGEVSDLATIFSAELWVEAYGANKQTGFVFTDKPRAEVYLAVERALAERGLLLEQQSWKLAKVSNREVAAVRNRFIEDVSLSAWLPHRIAPDYLTSKAATTHLEAAARNIGQFLRQNSIDPLPSLRAWLWQFPDSDLQESALRMVAQLRIVNRADRIDTWRRFIEKIDVASWCELSNSKKRGQSSSSRIAYEVKDLGSSAPRVESLLHCSVEVLKRQGRIVFIDDLLCSGTQASSLLYSWMGRPEEAPSQSDIDHVLPTEYQTLLQELPVHFIYPFALSAGVTELNKAFSKLGINGSVYSPPSNDDDTSLKNVEFACTGSRDRLHQFLRSKGTMLLQSKKTFDCAKREEFSVGYGGLQALVASDHSVPTATVTAIWAHDYNPKSLWLPLLPRSIANANSFKQRIETEKAKRALQRPPD